MKLKSTLPLLSAIPFLLVACSNPADEALELAEQSQSPQHCVDALMSILEEAQKSEDEQEATKRIARLKSVITNFSATDAVIFLSLLKEAETLERLQSLDAELAEKKIALPSIFLRPE